MSTVRRRTAWQLMPTLLGLTLLVGCGADEDDGNEGVVADPNEPGITQPEVQPEPPVAEQGPGAVPAGVAERPIDPVEAAAEIDPSAPVLEPPADPLPAVAPLDEPAALNEEGDDAALAAALAVADIVAGETIADRCLACHSLEQGGRHGIGPNLFGIFGASVAAAEGYDYSAAMSARGEAGELWTLEALNSFLESPAVAMPGTRMGFVGISNEADRMNIMAFLQSRTDDPDVAVPPLDENEVLPNPLTIGTLQAVDGAGWFGRLECSRCHGRGLAGIVDEREDGGGDGPPLKGPLFAAKWFDGNVYELFRSMRATMPPDQRGGLENTLYGELLAYILRENGFETGDINLPTSAAALMEMRFNQ